MYKNVGFIFARDMEAGKNILLEIEKIKKVKGISQVYKISWGREIYFEDNDLWVLINAMETAQLCRWNMAYIDSTLPPYVIRMIEEDSRDFGYSSDGKYYNPEDYKGDKKCTIITQ